MSKRDYYEVLGVPRSALVLEVRRAFRRLARQYSPDINLGDSGTGGLFEEIAEAYRVLGAPDTRALYDQMGHRAFAPSRGGPTMPPGRGEDLHCPVDVELEDVLRGLRAVIDAARLDPCVGCQATGGAAGHGAVRCPVCESRSSRGGVGRKAPPTAPCPRCRGTGWQLPPPCQACRGRGTVLGRARVPVWIPPGVDTGAQIRVSGEGHAAPSAGERGDLIVIARVRPHPLFVRKGDHLHCGVPITVPEAALGARIQIPTPDGPAAVTIPPGTQSGQVFRVRNRGCPRLDRDGRGDLLVETHVVIPRNADSTMEEILRALQRLLPENPRAELWSGRGA